MCIRDRDYLARHGRPEKPQDLERHNCLVHNLKAPTGQWSFTDAQSNTHVVRVAGSFNSNLGEALMNMTKRGGGVSMHPRYMVEQDIADGALEVLLPGYEPVSYTHLDVYKRQPRPAITRPCCRCAWGRASCP